MNAVTFLKLLHMLYRRMEIEINVGFHFIVHVFQHDIVDISTKMTHRCIKQL